MIAPTCAGRTCSTSDDPRPVAAAGDYCSACASDRAHRREILPVAGIPERFATATFDSPELVTWVTSAKARSVARWWGGRDRLLLRGPAGVGKTTLAAAVLRRLLDTSPKIQSACFVSSFDLGAARSRETKAKREPALVTLARTADVTIIDDLGQEPHDSGRTLASVIFARHAALKSTVFTTWATDEQLLELYGAGIARRIVSGALTIDLGDDAP